MSIDLNASGYPSSRGWGSGYPNCQMSKWRFVAVPGLNVSFGQVREEILELVVYLIAETHDRGYVFHDGQCWGAVCRTIRGSTAPSNHSWGLALDFNSATNWLGRMDGGDIPGWMVALWNDYGFRWGGDYSGREDPMHFEFMGSLGDAQAMTLKARAAQAEQEDEMAFSEFKEGWQAFVEGKDKQADWPADKKFGWLAARFAASNPKKAT